MDRHFHRGFSLIELMIVLAIAAIIGAVATSFFGDNVQKAQCTEGRNAVMRAAAALEKCRDEQYDVVFLCVDAATPVLASGHSRSGGVGMCGGPFREGQFCGEEAVRSDGDGRRARRQPA